MFRSRHLSSLVLAVAVALSWAVPQAAMAQEDLTCPKPNDVPSGKICFYEATNYDLAEQSRQEEPAPIGECRALPLDAGSAVNNSRVNVLLFGDEGCTNLVGKPELGLLPAGSDESEISPKARSYLAGASITRSESGTRALAG